MSLTMLIIKEMTLMFILNIWHCCIFHNFHYIGVIFPAMSNDISTSLTIDYTSKINLFFLI